MSYFAVVDGDHVRYVNLESLDDWIDTVAPRGFGHFEKLALGHHSFQAVLFSKG